MKKLAGIWIDSTKAVVVTFTGGRQVVVEVNSSIENRIYHSNEGKKGSFFGKQHVDSEKKFDARKKLQLDHFLDEVILKIKDSDELYVFGPAEVKTKLKQKIENGKPIPNGATILKAVEVADSMTRNQVVAKVKSFYNL